MLCIALCISHVHYFHMHYPDFMFSETLITWKPRLICQINIPKMAIYLKVYVTINMVRACWSVLITLINATLCFMVIQWMRRVTIVRKLSCGLKTLAQNFPQNLHLFIVLIGLYLYCIRICFLCRIKAYNNNLII